uniref:Leucine-rich repeat-containing N-terminal plant-type domain-containing protein n=1 Tax=Globisporangium ultimum (strain ATCC 200006 / CBS 805.95 / DAOM BR144) TaxID=431595 RepID=K3X7M6_GLOUD
MPKLEQLNLSSNSLTAIPSVIYQMTNLKTLSIQGNPLQTPAISNSQYAFLEKLSTFEVSAFADALPCDAAKQKQIGGVSLCVLDDAEFVSSTPSASSSSNNSDQTTSSTSSSASTAVIAGGIVGGIVVISLVGL